MTENLTIEEAAEPRLRLRPPVRPTPVRTGPVRTGPDRTRPAPLPPLQIVYAKIPVELHVLLKAAGINISATCRRALERAIGDPELIQERTIVEEKLNEDVEIRLKSLVDSFRKRAGTIPRSANLAWVRARIEDDRLLRRSDPFEILEYLEKVRDQ